MKRKSLLITLLSVIMALSCVSFGCMSAFAENEISLDNNGYKLSESFEVRLAYDGEDKLDTAYNGMRYKVELPKADYAELQKLNGDTTVVKYGILLAPTAYVEENALTYENVFGENRVYATSEAQKADDEANLKETKRVALVETATMAEGEDNYYFYCTLTNVQDVLRSYTAKAYLVKHTVDEYGIVTESEYKFVDGVKEMNMSYAVQKAVEAGKVSDEFIEDLNATYVADKNEILKVVYKTSYDGANEVTTTEEVEFALGATVTKDDVLAKVTGVDMDNYDLETEFVSQKVYAGHVEDVVLNFSAKKATDPKLAVGMYSAGDASVQVKADKLSCGEYVDVPYTLFMDGTVTVEKDAQKSILGHFDASKKEFALGEAELGQVLELGADLYAKVAGLYTIGGTIVKLNADGSVEYDLMGNTENRQFMMAYDEVAGQYSIKSGTLFNKKLTLGDTLSIEGFEKVENATEAQYNAIANYYSCVTEGDKLNKVYRFNVDGTVIENGVNAGNFLLFKDGGLSVKLGNSAYSAVMQEVNSSYGAKTKTLVLSDTNGVALTLKNESMADYSVATHNVNNLFGKTQLQFLGPVAGEIGKPRVILFNDDTQCDALKDIKKPDGTCLWKHAEYGSTGWGSFFKGLSYYIEQLTPTTGVIHFRKDAYPTPDNKLINYEITKDHEMCIDMRNYDPNGTGKDSQYQILHADISAPECRFTTTYSNIYNVFGSEVGSYYFPTDYRVESATGSNGGLVLYNYHTSVAGLENDWYACEYWSNITGNIQKDFEKTRIAYQIEFDTIKNVGRLTLRVGQYNKYYTIGIVNGNKFIDMRETSIAGYANFDTLKVSDQARADIDYPAISYAISTYGTTFNNIGEKAGGEQPAEKSIYEKIAGTYSSKFYYGETSNWWWGIGFTLNADKSMAMTSGISSPNSTYEIVELSDTFGEIYINCTYGLTDKNYAGYYALINGQYVFRITTRAMLNSKWSFMDYVPTGSSFKTWDVFDALIGKTASNGVTSAVYTDGNATLTLNTLDPKPNADGGEYYKGARCTLVDGTNTIACHYDLVASSLTGGKLFICIDDESDANKKYILGDYKLIDGKYALAFSIDVEGLKKDYVMYVGNGDFLKTQFAGQYYGTEDLTFTSSANVVFSSLSEGTISENGTTAKFVINGNRITLSYEKGGLDYVAIKY